MNCFGWHNIRLIKYSSCLFPLMICQKYWGVTNSGVYENWSNVIITETWLLSSCAIQLSALHPCIRAPYISASIIGLELEALSVVGGNNIPSDWDGILLQHAQPPSMRRQDKPDLEQQRLLPLTNCWPCSRISVWCGCRGPLEAGAEMMGLPTGAVIPMWSHARHGCVRPWP